MWHLFLIAAWLVLAVTRGTPQTSNEQKPVDKDENYRLTLAEFDEVPISASIPGRVLVRAIVWPTFESPMSIRIEVASGKAMLTAKRLDGMGGYKASGVRQVHTRTLTSSEWADLQRRLTEADFWSLKREDERFEPRADGSELICLDSTSWRIEVADGPRHHIVERYCPDQGTFKSLGLYLVSLSKFRLHREYL